MHTDDGLDGMGGHLPEPENDAPILAVIIGLAVFAFVLVCGIAWYVTQRY